MITPPIAIITHGIRSHHHARPSLKDKEMKQQSALMKFDPVTGAKNPYPSHAEQYRNWHGHSTAWLFNPWTGEMRDARNIGSDIVGHLIIPPGEPIYLAESEKLAAQ